MQIYYAICNIVRQYLINWVIHIRIQVDIPRKPKNLTRKCNTSFWSLFFRGQQINKGLKWLLGWKYTLYSDSDVWKHILMIVCHGFCHWICKLIKYVINCTLNVEQRSMTLPYKWNHDHVHHLMHTTIKFKINFTLVESSPTFLLFANFHLIEYV